MTNNLFKQLISRRNRCVAKIILGTFFYASIVSAEERKIKFTRNNLEISHLQIDSLQVRNHHDSTLNFSNQASNLLIYSSERAYESSIFMIAPLFAIEIPQKLAQSSDASVYQPSLTEQSPQLQDKKPSNLTENFSTQASDLLINSSEIANNFSPAIIEPVSEIEISPKVAQSADDDSSEEDLVKQSQNPIASLISVPFQNNTNFGVGQFDRTSNILNIQPVIPTSISEDWSLINRLIIPVSYQPELARIQLPNGDKRSIGDKFGLGDIVYQGFFSPKGSGKFTWGIGPILSFPTATDDILGTGQWGAGPAFVGLVTSGRIVAGALVSQLWSYTGDDDRSDVSVMTIQPFFNYNFDKGWYVTTSPIITANWQSEPGEQWTLPIGGGFGRVFNIGSQPVNMQIQGFYNVVKPENAADWTLRTQLTFLFPK